MKTYETANFAILVKYFGIASEITNRKEELLPLENKTMDDLKQNILTKYPDLSKIDFKFALNKSLVSTNPSLNKGDVVALLPPYAGG